MVADRRTRRPPSPAGWSARYRPQELEGRNQRSALFKTMFLAFRAAAPRIGARRLPSPLTTRARSIGSSFITSFPRPSSRTATLAAMRMYLQSMAHRRQDQPTISDKSPSQYFSPVIEKSGAGAFEAQCIPTDPAQLSVEDYKASCISAVRWWRSTQSIPRRRLEEPVRRPRNTRRHPQLNCRYQLTVWLSARNRTFHDVRECVIVVFA